MKLYIKFKDGHVWKLIMTLMPDISPTMALKAVKEDYEKSKLKWDNVPDADFCLLPDFFGSHVTEEYVALFQKYQRQDEYNQKRHGKPRKPRRQNFQFEYAEISGPPKNFARHIGDRNTQNRPYHDRLIDMILQGKVV